MQWVRNYDPRPKQTSLIRQALIITLGGNILLAGIKGLVAYISGSAALPDAANSISDVVYSLLIIWGYGCPATLTFASSGHSAASNRW
jgi:divalent metal cation (Fe/Co/Zn/Cd) transporter